MSRRTAVRSPTFKGTPPAAMGLTPSTRLELRRLYRGAPPAHNEIPGGKTHDHRPAG